MDRVRVLTLNCWNLSSPFEERMELIRSGIEALQPDLIGLQEIVVRRDGFDQGAMLLEGLGYEWAYGAAVRWTEDHPLLPWDAHGDGLGNVAASRWPILRSAVEPLPGEETGERRSAIALHVDSPWGSLSFTSTHLNWKYRHGPVRERQVVALADFVDRWSEGACAPPILVGDLNAEPDSAEVRFLCGLQSLDGRGVFFQDAWRVAGNGGPGFTWDNVNSQAAISHEPNRRIDYVMSGEADPMTGRGRIETASVAFAEPENGVFPSDHFGVLAEIRM